MEAETVYITASEPSNPSYIHEVMTVQIGRSSGRVPELVIDHNLGLEPVLRSRSYGSSE